MSDDVAKKFKRQLDGTLSDEGSLAMPAGSISIGTVIVSDTKAYISLRNAGKKLIPNKNVLFKWKLFSKMPLL